MKSTFTSYGFSRRLASLCIMTSMIGNIIPLSTFADSSIFGTTGAGPIQMVIDGSGNIYTANQNNSNITKIAPDGTTTVAWASTGTYPTSIAVDGSGNVYVEENGGNMDKITPGGSLSTFGSTGGGPGGITVDGSGNIYKARYYSNQVMKLTPTGSLSTFATTGSYPEGITIDGSGNVYTTNLSDNTVTKISSDGTSSTILGTTGNRPIGIAVDGSGNVYTSNTTYNTVTKITPDGTSRIIGTTGRNPNGIVVDGSGNVYTNNFDDSTVTKITPPYLSSPVVTFQDPATNVIDKYVGRESPSDYYDFANNYPVYWIDPINGEGTFSAQSSGSVDIDNTGSYTLNYSYTDNSGNTASLDRTVNIMDFADMSHISTYNQSPALYGKVLDPDITDVDVTIAGKTYPGGVYTNDADGSKFWYLPESTITPELAPGSYNVKLDFSIRYSEWYDTYKTLNRCLTIIGSGSIAPCTEGTGSNVADVSLTKTLTNTGVIHAGDPVGYTFTLTNLSSTDTYTSDDTQLIDAMPDIIDMGTGTSSESSVVSTGNPLIACEKHGTFTEDFSSHPYGDYPNTNDIQCYNTIQLNIAPGGSTSFTMTGTATADFPDGLTNRALFIDWSSSTTDPESPTIQSVMNNAADYGYGYGYGNNDVYTEVPNGGMFGFSGNNVATSVYHNVPTPAPFCDPAAIGVRSSAASVGSCSIGTASGFLSISSGGAMNYSWSCSTETQTVSCDASYKPQVASIGPGGGGGYVPPPSSGGGGGGSPLPLPVSSPSGIGNTGTIIPISTSTGTTKIKNSPIWTKTQKTTPTKFTAVAPVSALGNGVEITPNICTSILKMHNLSDIRATDLDYSEFRSSIQKLIMYRGDWTQTDGTLPHPEDGIASNQVNFYGANNITRGEYVTMLVRALGCMYEPGAKTVNPFPDVSDSLPSALYINYAVSQKWVNGYADGGFRPNGLISRGEAAKILANAIYMSTNQLKQNNINLKLLSFEDLQNGNEFAKYVYALKQGGILNGKTPVLFGVDDSISRQEVAKIFANTFLKGIN